MILRPLNAAGVLALLAALVPAQAASLTADGQWNEFFVDELQSGSFGLEWLAEGGAPAVFSVTIDVGFVGTLTVVDAGFSGDRFTVSDHGKVIGVTSLGIDGDSINDTPVLDYGLALTNPAFSRGVFRLGAGTHELTGLLSTSLVNEYGPLNATSGALRLEVSAVPEPARLATLLAGLSVLGVVLRRRGGPK